MVPSSHPAELPTKPSVGTLLPHTFFCSPRAHTNGTNASTGASSTDLASPGSVCW